MEGEIQDVDPTRHDEKENPYRIDDTGEELGKGEELSGEPTPSTSKPTYNPNRKKAQPSFIKKNTNKYKTNKTHKGGS